MHLSTHFRGEEKCFVPVMEAHHDAMVVKATVEVRCHATSMVYGSCTVLSVLGTSIADRANNTLFLLECQSLETGL